MPKTADAEETNEGAVLMAVLCVFTLINATFYASPVWPVEVGN